MIQVLLIEDEEPAAKRLQKLLNETTEEVNVLAVVDSIRSAKEWLQNHAAPQLILADIHLADGDSFEIFKRTSTHKPVIFTTAYENYAIDAFQLFSIDYILKPVTAQSLAAAFNKYKNLSTAFIPHNYELLIEQVKDNVLNNYKTRFLAKVGKRLFFVPAEINVFSLPSSRVIL